MIVKLFKRRVFLIISSVLLAGCVDFSIFIPHQESIESAISRYTQWASAKLNIPAEDLTLGSHYEYLVKVAAPLKAQDDTLVVAYYYVRRIDELYFCIMSPRVWSCEKRATEESLDKYKRAVDKK